MFSLLLLNRWLRSGEGVLEEDTSFVPKSHTSVLNKLHFELISLTHWLTLHTLNEHHVRDKAVCLFAICRQKVVVEGEEEEEEFKKQGHFL